MNANLTETCEIIVVKQWGGREVTKKVKVTSQVKTGSWDF